MLRRMIVFLAVLSLALSFWTVPAAAKTETSHLSFKSQSAFAFFSSVDPTGCIETSVSILATERRVQEDGKPETTSEAILSISQFNSCTEETMLSASGSTTLAPEAFEIDKQLDQASLNTTIVVEDFVTNATIPIEVSLIWTGVGQAVTTKNKINFKEPGIHLIFHFTGTSREASASGTVTGLGTNFTPEPAIFALLTDLKEGNIYIFYDF